VIVARDFEKMFEGVAGRGRLAAAARILHSLGHDLDPGLNEAHLIWTVIFCVKLKNAQVAITAQTPNQKLLAYMFPSIWNSASSRISPRNIEASVEFEKSMPEALSGESMGAPPIIIVPPISIFAVLKKCSLICRGSYPAWDSGVGKGHEVGKLLGN
jgi:hypothetical protein